MRKVTRLLLIHWYGYDKEVIEFGDINFLTGKTASGKSTIIDALQLLLLGDTSGTFFNKAANDKSVRTLKGYLFGETGDDGDTGYQYLRNSRFTSYVALEFLDTEKNTNFVTGFVADCFKDQTYKSRWFILRDSALPENLFIDEKTHVPYTLESELKPFLNREIGKKKYDLFDTNRSFQNALLGVYGQVKRKYLILLRKAVPFSPITDIEGFITESICDVKNRINVEEMQSEIRQYKHLEDDAARIRVRIERLGEIHEESAKYDQQVDTLHQQEYIVDRAEQEEKKAEKVSLTEALVGYQIKLTSNDDKIKKLMQEIEEISAEIDDLQAAYASSDLTRRAEDLERRLGELKKQLKNLTDRRDRAVDQVRKYGDTWGHVIEEMAAIPDVASEVEAGGLFVIRPEERKIVSDMVGMQKETISSFALRSSMDAVKGLKEKIENAASDLRAEVKRLESEIKELESRAANLRKGIKPYPTYVITLKSLLERELSKKTKRPVTVSILAEMLEIADPSWQNAIEGYLDKQKFYLMVPEKYYRDAVVIYNEAKRDMNIYDAGLVDIASLRRDQEKKYGEQEILTGKDGVLLTRGQKGSLAEEIETKDPDARLYADYLLGNVMKCEDARELNKHRTSITKSCLLYKGYVARKINPRRYAEPFIGRESIRRQLEQVEKELKEEKAYYAVKDDIFGRVRSASRTEVMADYEISEHEASIEDSRNIPDLEQKKNALQEEYDGLDLTSLQKMKQKIQEKKRTVHARREESQQLVEENGRFREKARQIQDEKLPSVISENQRIADRIAATYAEEWIASVGEPRFQKELRDKEKNHRVSLSLRESYSRAASATQTTINKILERRTELRSKYNAEFRMPYDINLTSNREYDEELEKLSTYELPQYVDKIQNSKEKAYNQFRDDFIAKLKSNIEDVQKQIEELNASLRGTKFGTDRYRFTRKPREEFRRYYDMIMDPLLMDTGGWNIASENFNKKYQKEIDELFQIMILSDENTSEAKRQEYEKNVQKYTDYRSYLVFDLVVTNDQGEEQRLSKMLNKKSGGETQIPFYIALLASFSQVLRIRTKQNNTIRLIILDEAFSKLDGERIQQSIPLLRQFGLQAVFSAPTDKIPDIAPLVDRNIAVYKDGHHSFTRHFDPREIEGNEGFIETT